MRLLFLVVAVLLSSAVHATGNVWLVQIDIDKVSENNLKLPGAETTEPTPVTRSFSYKLYAYENESGVMSILPTAGIFYNIASGTDTECADVDILDGMVLYLEVDTKSFYKGCHLRTIINSAIPYDGDRDTPPSILTGSGGLEGGDITFSATLAGNHPVNPFLHLYHPDHNNPTTEVRIRQIARTLSFSDLKLVQGQKNTYSAVINEEISGLQRLPIKSSGQATFLRIHHNVKLGLGTAQ